MASNVNIPAYDLGQVKLTVGVVLSHDDPDSRGRVKAYVPGLFSSKTMDVEAMPWIWPLKMWGYQSFSLQNQNTKIWVIILPDNPYGYFYMPFFELNTMTKSLISGDTDIMMSRTTSNGNAAVYYNKTDGVVSKIGDSKFQVFNNLNAGMYSKGSNVKIESGKVIVGKQGGSAEPMVMGDKLVDLLNNLSSGLNKVAQKMIANPYVNAVGGELLSVVSQLNSDISTIQSGTCSLTK